MMLIDLLITWAVLYLTAFLFGLSSNACGAFIASFAAVLFLGPALAVACGGGGVLVLLLVGFAGAAAGLAQYFLLRLPLESRQSQSAPRLVASFGLHLAAINTLILFVGEDRILLESRVLGRLGEYSLSIPQLTLVTAALLIAGCWALSRKARFGLRFRAVLSDPALARSYGVRMLRVHASFAAFAGIGLALLGVGIASDTGLSPLGTLPIFFLGAVAYIVTGRRTLDGLALGSLILSVLLQVSTRLVGSGWREAIALGMLLVVFAARHIAAGTRARHLLRGYAFRHATETLNRC